MDIEFIVEKLDKPIKSCDIDQLIGLEKKMFGYHGYPRYFFMQSVEIGMKLFIARSAKKDIIGYIIGSEKTDKESWILSICVDNIFSRTGIGSGLLKSLIGSMKSNGICSIFAASDPQNIPLINFYQKHGFEIIELRKDYHGSGYSRYILQKNL